MQFIEQPMMLMTFLMLYQMFFGGLLIVPALTCLFVILRKQHTENPNKAHPAAGTILSTGTPMVVFLLQITALLLTGVLVWQILVLHDLPSIIFMLLTNSVAALTSLYLLYKILSEHMRHRFEPHFVLFFIAIQFTVLIASAFALSASLTISPASSSLLGLAVFVAGTSLLLGLSIAATILLGYRWVYGLKKRRCLHYALTVFLLLLLLPAMFLMGEYYEAIPTMLHF